MTEDELYGHFFASMMFQKWHWFRWHFEHRLRGGAHPLARDIVRALLDCDAIFLASRSACATNSPRYPAGRNTSLTGSNSCSGWQKSTSFGRRWVKRCQEQFPVILSAAMVSDAPLLGLT